MEGTPPGAAPSSALAAVLKHSSALPPESAQVQGYDFNRGVDYHALLEAYGTTGFQATNFGRAVQQVNAMVRCGATRAGGGAAPCGFPRACPGEAESWYTSVLRWEDLGVKN